MHAYEPIQWTQMWGRDEACAEGWWWPGRGQWEEKETYVILKQ